jgi:hypothetical protein
MIVQEDALMEISVNAGEARQPMTLYGACSGSFNEFTAGE